MARIGIDATAAQSFGKGVALYQRSIVRFLAQTDSSHEYIVFHRSLNIEELCPERPNWHFIKVPFFMSWIWDQVQLPWLVRKYRLDLVHTAYDRLPILTRVPFVVYLFEIPTYRVTLARRLHRRGRWYQRLAETYNLSVFPYSMRKAAIIVSSSEFTKRDLTDRFRIPEEKIRIVYAAHAETFRPAPNISSCEKIRERVSGGSEYFLHFSTGDARENTDVVLKGFRLAKARLPQNFRLVIVGIDPKCHYLTHGLRRYDALIDSVICRGFATGEELVNLYQAATAYIDPSLYEGFGFQPLEAMACGTPVIASNVTSIPEVVGEAGILISPNDPNCLARAMIKICTDRELQSRLREQGLRRAREFSWPQAVQQILGMFDQVLADHNKVILLKTSHASF